MRNSRKNLVTPLTSTNIYNCFEIVLNQKQRYNAPVSEIFLNQDFSRLKVSKFSQSFFIMSKKNIVGETNF